jgi:hypothetical protein
MTPSTITPMPPRLKPEQYAKLTPEERLSRSAQIAKAAVDLCRTDKELFLKTYPKLDFRKKATPASSPAPPLLPHRTR